MRELIDNLELIIDKKYYLHPVRRVWIILFISYQLSIVNCAAQALQFQQDTTAVGAEVKATAVFRYPLGSILVMPDTVKGYAPFEHIRHERLKSETRGLFQYDSVYLVLRTFQLDSVQFLELPYQYVDNGDTVRASAGRDSIRLNYRMPVVTPETQLIPHFELAHIEKPFPIALVLALGGIVVALLAAAWVFGRAPYRRWRRRKALQRRYDQLCSRITQLTPLRDKDLIGYLNQLNAAWRQFLQDDFPVQLASLTARELDQLLQTTQSLPSDHAELLVQLSRWEESLNYAHRAVPAAALAQSQQQLDALLEATYARRKEAIG